MKNIFQEIAEKVEDKKKYASLLIGRLQPFHLGHIAAIKKMSYTPVIVIVKGKKSSDDAEHNPLDLGYQKKLIKKVYPSMHILEAETGFIPAIISQVKTDFNLDVKEIVAGEDRFKSYKDQIERANKSALKNQGNPDKEQHPQIEIEKYTQAPRITSATAVREAIRSGDKTTFNKLMPSQLQSEWVNLREILSNVSEGEFIMHDIMLTENEGLVTILNDGNGSKVYVYRKGKDEFEVEDHGKITKIMGLNKLKELITKFIDELGYQPGYK